MATTERIAPPVLSLVTRAHGQAQARVLLVSDSASEAQLFDHDLVQANGVAGALELIASAPPVCVVVDLHLAEAPGLDALTRLRAAAPDIPFVALVDDPRDLLVVRALQEGAQGYLVRADLGGPQLAGAVEGAITRRRAELELAARALNDGLTGLPSATLFLDRLSVALAGSTRRRNATALMMVDIQGLGRINRDLGHETGDRVLIATADRLRAAVRAHDTVARVGGDEFAVICQDVRRLSEAMVAMQRISAAVTRPIEIDGRSLPVRAAVGITWSAGRPHPPEALIRNAEGALHLAKQRGEPTFHSDLHRRRRDAAA